MEHEPRILSNSRKSNNVPYATANTAEATAKAGTNLLGVSSAATVAPRRSRINTLMPEQASTSRVHFAGWMRKKTSSTETLFCKNLNELTSYFLGFWKAPHAATALGHLGELEIKRELRALQEVHGSWHPPEDVAEALKRPPKPAPSFHPASKEARNLKFVLKILGCSMHENKPYNQFVKAKSLRQKRYWLYRYQRHKRSPSSSYQEPICPTRLKRLYQFFPNNFTEENDSIYFNNKMLTYDKTKDIYYIGKQLKEE